MTDLTSTIARLRALEAKATPGPWEESDVPSEPRIQCEARGEEIAWVFGAEKRTTENFANRALIVALRNAATALFDAAEQADAIERLTRERDEARLSYDLLRQRADHSLSPELLRRVNIEHNARLDAERERDEARAKLREASASKYFFAKKALAASPPAPEPPMTDRDPVQEAVERAALAWQPIETAPRERWKPIDIWIVHRPTGKGQRVANALWAPHEGKDAWENSEYPRRWVTGKRYNDWEGDECFDPCSTDEQSTVATHWMPLPAPPKPETER